METREEFSKCLQGYINQLGITLPDEAVTNSWHHFQTLNQWMHQTNLISTNTTPEEIVQNHYADSLAAWGLLRSENVVDLGSGAGFPGWPLAGSYPDKNFILVEPRRKRVSFLETATANAKLKNIKIQLSKIEKALLPTGDWDLIQRAVFPPDELWEKIGTGNLHPVTILTWSMVDYLDKNNSGAQKAGYRLLTSRPLPWSDRRVLLCYGR